MRAIAYGLTENGHPRVALVYFPEAEIVSLADHNTMLINAKDSTDLRFFRQSPERQICEFEVSFDLVAKLYALLHDFRHAELAEADRVLWNEELKTHIRHILDKQRTATPHQCCG